MSRWVPIVAGLAIAVIAGPALATGPFAGVEFPLKKADLAMISAAEDAIADRGAAVGDEEAWSNAETGSSGRVKVLRDYTAQGRDCKEVGYEVKFSGLSDTYTFKFSYCEVAEGDWKLYFR